MSWQNNRGYNLKRMYYRY